MDPSQTNCSQKEARSGYDNSLHIDEVTSNMPRRRIRSSCAFIRFSQATGRSLLFYKLKPEILVWPLEISLCKPKQSGMMQMFANEKGQIVVMARFPPCKSRQFTRACFPERGEHPLKKKNQETFNQIGWVPKE